MAYRKTEGVVLRVTDYSESSQIVWLLSRDYGLIRLLAKGSKRQTKRSQGAFDALTRIALVYVPKQRGGLHVAAEWQALDAFAGLRKNLGSLYSAFYMAELVMAFLDESEEVGGTFQMMVDTLARLARDEDRELALFRFELKLLQESGYSPEVNACAQCGRGDKSLRGFSPSVGGAVCGGCAGTLPDSIKISRGALASIDRLGGSKREGERLRIAGPMKAEIRRALSAYIRFLIGREPKTAKYIEQVGVGSKG